MQKRYNSLSIHIKLNLSVFKGNSDPITPHKIEISKITAIKKTHEPLSFFIEFEHTQQIHPRINNVPHLDKSEFGRSGFIGKSF